jgi:hypothetical protein
LAVLLVDTELLFILLLLYYTATRRVKIDVGFNPRGSVAVIVSQMTSFKS